MHIISLRWSLRLLLLIVDLVRAAPRVRAGRFIRRYIPVWSSVDRRAGGMAGLAVGRLTPSSTHQAGLLYKGILVANLAVKYVRYEAAFRSELNSIALIF